MIVISHSWEFTPKGNSQFNYLTNGHITTALSTAALGTPASSSIQNSAKQKLATSKSDTTGGFNTPAAGGDHAHSTSTTSQTVLNQNAQKIQPSVVKPQFYLQKSHLNRLISSSSTSSIKKSVNIPEDDSSSLSEISFAYYHKSPMVSNKITIEPAVKKVLFYVVITFLKNFFNLIILERKMALETSE